MRRTDRSRHTSQFSRRPLHLHRLAIAAFFLVPVLWTVTHGFTQPPNIPIDSQIADDPDVPKSALLTERGRELAAHLVQLKRTSATLGGKHPSLEAIRQEIDEVKEQLKAWAAGSDAIANAGAGAGARPGRSTRDLEQAALETPTMNDQDLRQLVLRLAVKIDQLDNRMSRLERDMDRIERARMRQQRQQP